MYVSSGIGKTLIQLERSGFQCSEADPLLLLCSDPTNYEASMAYLHGGNYALPAGTPGRRDWPTGAAPANGTPLVYLPAGVDAAPPFALGRFILERSPVAVDRTHGTSMDVLHVPDLEVFGNICLALLRSVQFGRTDPVKAAKFGIDCEPPLVRGFLLDRIDGRPLAQPQFTLG